MISLLLLMLQQSLLSKVNFVQFITSNRSHFLVIEAFFVDVGHRHYTGVVAVVVVAMGEYLSLTFFFSI